MSADTAFTADTEIQDISEVDATLERAFDANVSMGDPSGKNQKPSVGLIITGTQGGERRLAAAANGTTFTRKLFSKSQGVTKLSFTTKGSGRGTKFAGYQYKLTKNGQNRFTELGITDVRVVEVPKAMMQNIKSRVAAQREMSFTPVKERFDNETATAEAQICSEENW